MTKPFRFGKVGLLAAALPALLSVSCASDLTRTGRSPAFLVIDRLDAASGAKAQEFGAQLNSDVITLVNQTVNGTQVKVPTIFNDMGRATMRLQLKDPGTQGLATTPSALNEITIVRYHVTFKRADGRNNPGVDVPWPFDGAVTATITAKDAITFAFELVRHSMKEEPPLKNMQNGGGANLISTIAEVTFYGRDQAGNEVSVTGQISVNFGDFGDPS
jgi:hypothetical protein